MSSSVAFNPKADIDVGGSGNTPHLASALLHHIDPAVTEAHYNRASSISAAQGYAAFIRAIRSS